MREEEEKEIIVDERVERVSSIEQVNRCHHKITESTESREHTSELERRSSSPSSLPHSMTSAFKRVDITGTPRAPHQSFTQGFSTATSINHSLLNLLSSDKQQTCSNTLSTHSQLDLMPLMHQWNLAAFRQATLFGLTTGSYFPYGFLPLSSSPGSAPLNSAINPSSFSGMQLTDVAAAPSGMTHQGPMDRRAHNPYKITPVKKYKCEECGKAFSRSNTLVTHKRIHTGEKPFTCNSCGRAFRQPGNLTRHKLTHTTVKPYVCPACGKAFNRASNLHTHMRTHANLRPFTCNLCAKSFQHNTDLKVHIYTHTGILSVGAVAGHLVP